MTPVVPAAPPATFEVVLERSGVSVHVGPEASTLEALEDAGIFPACSCREGKCGTCETPVLEGRPDHRDSILMPEERERSETMMICVSRALSARLVLDL